MTKNNMELDLMPMADMELELEALGVTPAQYAALDARVQANTDAVGVLDGRVDGAEAEIGQRYTKTETDGLLAGKVDLADSLTLKNLITNGDFSQGTTGLTHKFSDISVVDGVLGVTPYAQWGQFVSNAFQAKANNYYYLHAKVKSPSKLFLGWNSKAVNPKTTGSNVWELYSTVFRNDTDINNCTFGLIDGSTSDFQPSYFDDIAVINLTDTFGAGNEPTAPEMRMLIDLLGGWFDGEITVPQKTLAIWTLNLIRQNRNAIIALGGTII